MIIKGQGLNIKYEASAEGVRFENCLQFKLPAVFCISYSSTGTDSKFASLARGGL